MHYEVRDNQLHLQRLPEDKGHLIQRLNRIEGQVRGLRQMIEKDRYCVDIVQQTSAISAAIREVTLLLISQHLKTGIPLVSENGGLLKEEIVGILQSAIGHPRAATEAQGSASR